MKPFRTSPTARIVSLAVALSLVGGGLLAVTGAGPSVALPLLLLASIGACIVGLVLGANEHTGPVALLAILLPLALWPYVMTMEWIVTSAPRYGSALLIAGGVMLGMTLLATVTTREPAERKLPEPALNR